MGEPAKNIFYFSGAPRGEPALACPTERSRSGTHVNDHHRPTLAEAYGRRRSQIRTFFWRRTGSQEAADDLTQEVWLRIAKTADDDDYANPDAWLQRIVVNLALNWLRQHHFQARFVIASGDDYDTIDETPGHDRLVQSRESLAYLRDLIDELPPRRRVAFLLYRGEGLSLGETAKRMGVSHSTAKKQIAAALLFLRDRMGEAGLWP